MTTVPAPAPKAGRSAGPRAAPAPPVPETIRETGISEELIRDLLIKILYSQGARTGQQLMDIIRLPFPIVDDLLLGLQQRRFAEVKGTSGAGRAGYIFDLTSAGRDRAREAMAICQYAGPAPVPLQAYRTSVDGQGTMHADVTRETIAAQLAELVVDAALLDSLGPAVNSAKSIMLYGDPGNGKTIIAEKLCGLLGGAIFVPYAVEVEGQIIAVYDPVYHRPVAEPDPVVADASGAPDWLRAAPDYDRRYIRVERPVVMTGGELTLDQLDLQYDLETKMYQAPFQVKANGGVLIIDDFGRQRMAPRDLLNRWIVPLEKRVDFMTLHTGSKFPVPFQCLLLIATNIDLHDLVEEAFLRRIHYKIRIDNPSREQYVEIFRRYCASKRIPFSPAAAEHVFRTYYERLGIPMRCCHPRDIVDHLIDLARYLEVEPALSVDLLDRACASYFVHNQT